MSWGEALDLTMVLIADSTSQVGAAVAGWQYPSSREALALADLFDMTATINSGRKKPTPYPRPWDKQPARIGRPSVSQARVRAALEAAGHGRGQAVDGTVDLTAAAPTSAAAPTAISTQTTGR